MPPTTRSYCAIIQQSLGPQLGAQGDLQSSASPHRFCGSVRTSDSAMFRLLSTRRTILQGAPIGRAYSTCVILRTNCVDITVVANYRFGTWNIGTLKGKSGDVCEVLHRWKVKVCCIQEARWKDEGSRALQGYKLIWKGNSEGTVGVGVLVASEIADRIMRVERISDRVIAVDLVIGEQIVKVVSCYTPQAGRSQIEKEGF